MPTMNPPLASDSLSASTFVASVPAVERNARNEISEQSWQIELLESELSQMSDHLGRTFEELSLIHELSRHIHIAKDARAHCREALTKLLECLPVESLIAIVELDSDSAAYSMGNTFEVVQVGKEIRQSLLLRINEEIGASNPQVINHPLRCAPLVNRLAVVQLDNRAGCSGRLIAVGSATQAELGTPEVQLMQSVASILRSHLEIHRQFSAMRQMFEGTVRALVSAIDAKDPYTCGHSSRVSELAESLAREMGMSDAEIETVRMAGLLHDIGKIGVSDAVLRKPGKLTDAEYAEIKRHPELGYRILRDIPQFNKILPGVRYHHEAWDGSGYPLGLRGESIPLIARVLAVADAFDAMTSTRTYRAGMPLERVMEVLAAGSGQQWDAEVVTLLLGDHERMQRMISKI